MKQFFVGHLRFVAGVVVILLAGITIWAIFSKPEPALGSYTVSRANIISTIDIPGTVASGSNVDLSFQESGQIAAVYVKEGDSVSAGEALASLDTSSQQTALSQEKAALAAAQAKLDELESGTRPEQIQVQDVAVNNASTTLDDAATSLVDSLKDTFTKSDDAIRNQVDQFINNPTAQNSSFPFNVSDTQLASNTLWERYTIEPVLNSWKDMVSGLGTTSDLATITATTNANLSTTKALLDDVASIVNNVTPVSTAVTGYRSSVATARTNVALAISNLAIASQSYNTAKSNLSLQASQLALENAGTVPDEIAAQKAVVLQAQATIDNANLTINHATIVAPFSGVMRNVIAERGMVVSPNVPVLSIINNGVLKINAYASETDIPKVQVNASASVYLDSYGDAVNFPSKVTAVDTAGTTINGSPAYHVTLYFSRPDSKLRVGMTGNVLITAAEHDNVVSVPSRLVLGGEGDNFVLLQNGGERVSQPVMLGLSGDNGMVEIVSGLNVGEKISDF